MCQQFILEHYEEVTVSQSYFELSEQLKLEIQECYLQFKERIGGWMGQMPPSEIAGFMHPLVEKYLLEQVQNLKIEKEFMGEVESPVGKLKLCLSNFVLTSKFNKLIKQNQVQVQLNQEKLELYIQINDINAILRDVMWKVYSFTLNDPDLISDDETIDSGSVDVIIDGWCINVVLKIYPQNEKPQLSLKHIHVTIDRFRPDFRLNFQHNWLCTPCLELMEQLKPIFNEGQFASSIKHAVLLLTDVINLGAAELDKPPEIDESE
eukprot:TRINITY_DN4395_c0_g1_i1.p1 TRINITY_DN4395_c0_g1~~TRINITY_DN4395_c0_g1_i1.p1  ORF type:complete len:264 (+),score=50.35 TRINITY_DN4395_c0_g1_i1:366-1157(+)